MPSEQMNKKINDVNITEQKVLLTPIELKNQYPLSDEMAEFIVQKRADIADIIHKRSDKFLVVCGPCSIHDVDSAIEYAQKLSALLPQINDSLEIVMRVYFEKPRTTVGWKGLVNDPDLTDTFDLEKGLKISRDLLLKLTALKLPLATEALDPTVPQYIGDLFSYSAIGARTTESQTHRELASGLSMTVGFKNGTDGNLDVAINALCACSSSHRFLGINQKGQVNLLTTAGNPDGHVILRGGKQPNYDSVSVGQCREKLLSSGLLDAIMIDCSHGNSKKDYRNQGLVLKDIMNQIKGGDRSIVGVMIESHLFEGCQNLTDVNNLKYGVSITDSCIGFTETSELLLKLAQVICERNSSK